MTVGRERAGKTIEGFDVVPAVPAALVEDPAAGPYAAMRTELLTYFGLPFYRAMLERSGFGGEIEAYDAAAGDLERMRAAISERFLSQLTAVGDEAAVRAGIDRYRKGRGTCFLAVMSGRSRRSDFEGCAPQGRYQVAAQSQYPGRRRTDRFRIGAGGRIGCRLWACIQWVHGELCVGDHRAQLAALLPLAGRRIWRFRSTTRASTRSTPRTGERSEVVDELQEAVVQGAWTACTISRTSASTTAAWSRSRTAGNG